ncbi:ubiquitin-like modifier-activating enzyme 1 [Octopus sinensis]|uniref:Ubiquitin-like modifier-activating enzyme 1 n=1 Tax=Octopus sinensis TaxID=2607531 RepID=A0A7E6EMM4_9MOLL|nr:ubiquitin-like modifier-activating enzyme 1 [Octopus sinensis]
MERIERSTTTDNFSLRSTDMMRPKSTTAAASSSNQGTEQGHEHPGIGVSSRHPIFLLTDFYSTTSSNASTDFVLTVLPSTDLTGTHGAKGHCQPDIPHLTESYFSNDPITHDFAFCTVRHFLNSIEHCIQFALDYFRGVFYKPDRGRPQIYSFSPHSSVPHPLVLALGFLPPLHAPFDWPLLMRVSWAFRQFHDHFTNNISQLLHNFPPITLPCFAWTLWDRIEITHKMTLSQLFEYLRDEYRFNGRRVVSGKCHFIFLLHAARAQPPKQRTRMAME